MSRVRRLEYFCSELSDAYGVQCCRGIAHMLLKTRNLRTLCLRGALDSSFLNVRVYLRQSNHQLTWLDLSNNSEYVGNDLMELISVNCSGLRVLEVAGCAKLDTGGMWCMERLEHLQLINIADTRITFQCLINTLGLRAMVCCDCCGLERVSDAFEWFPNLEHIEVTSCRMNPPLYRDFTWSDKLMSIMRGLGYVELACHLRHKYPK